MYDTLAPVLRGFSDLSRFLLRRRSFIVLPP